MDRVEQHSVLTEVEAVRYSRLMRFHRIGESGLRRFRQAKVVIIGCGALGAQHAETLTRAGFGHLTLIDRDFVEYSNLQRQTLFTEADAKQALPKVIALKNHLLRINPSVEITTHLMDVASDNIERLIAGHDLLLDGTDHLSLRLLINDACYKLAIPWIFGSALESYGMSYNFNIPADNKLKKKLPCLRCLSDYLPLDTQDSCSSVGVIQPILQIISGIQTTEAMKLLIDPTALRNTLLTIDLWPFHQQNIAIESLKKSDCPTCGDHPSYPALNRPKRKVQKLCGEGTVMIREENPLDLEMLKVALDKDKISYQYNAYFLNIHLAQHRIILFADGRGIVYGARDEVEALGVYEGIMKHYAKL
ncbi:thiamine/molybdopterin biosynthesis protein MoeB [Ignatzschineria ureiclastica]|uniref:ThiF family adenylyltransferase n=1 Tax=Ignatzschineria ureiclastica TaxID=472582 RepID=UPI00198D7C09|nr:ThiF family adenylyltransferase [Ignatzschineria ureiclastica]GGZ97101.1 thiamine/molybdopterin biosynthesis protein MoeB [Ignatzschineria ureiclastica]